MDWKTIHNTLLLYVVLHVDFLNNESQCFDIGEKSICYFRPNVSSVDWDTVWKICRDLDSTLPVIPDKEVQAVLVEYLNNDYSIMSVWTAGRYTGDGQNFRSIGNYATL